MATASETPRAPVAAAPGSAWAPLRHRTFRALWIAAFASNVGTWMQIVGAQWLMGDLGGGAFSVALVQTMSSLPIFLFAVLSGALGDIFDRRRLLLASQGSMVLAAAALAALTVAGLVTPAVLLALTFALGLGQAVTMPSWQAIQPDLVDRAEIPQAAALNGVNFNVARAVGPAVGGIFIASLGPAAVFVLNGVSFAGTLAVLALWRRPQTARAFPAEHLWPAVRSGWRFVASAPRMHVLLARAGLFVFFASALWALLPTVARGPLGLGSGGYGLLLGSVGIGAVLGAFLLPWLRSHVSLDGLVTGASVAYGLACLTVGLVETAAPVVLALVVAGLAWISAFSSLNATAQGLLPNWTRARGFAYYTLTFMGGQAIGSAVWGLLADATSLRAAFLVVAAGLGASALVARRLPLERVELDLRPAPHVAEPHLVLEPEPSDGPILVTVAYAVAPEAAGAFRDAMAEVERSRRRTGAERWGLFQDGAEPTRFLEAYVVPTWEEHLRQVEERSTVRDAELEAAARTLLLPGTEPEISRLVSAARR